MKTLHGFVAREAASTGQLKAEQRRHAMDDVRENAIEAACVAIRMLCHAGSALLAARMAVDAYELTLSQSSQPSAPDERISQEEFDSIVSGLHEALPMLRHVLKARPDISTWPQHLQNEVYEHAGYRPVTVYEKISKATGGQA